MTSGIGLCFFRPRATTQRRHEARRFFFVVESVKPVESVFGSITAAFRRFFVTQSRTEYTQRGTESGEIGRIVSSRKGANGTPPFPLLTPSLSLPFSPSQHKAGEPVPSIGIRIRLPQRNRPVP